MATSLPVRPPWSLRARILTPLAAGGTRYEADGRIDIDRRGVITRVGPWVDRAPDRDGPTVDLRPLVLLPGMVDLHVHLPQVPNAGVGAGLHLLDWLERYIFPLERAFDERTAERVAPAALRAFAAAGTTTAVMYSAVYEASTDAAFRAAEAHGICDRWHGRDGGRLRYAFTPRFAVSCSADLLRESASLARSTGAYWQTHLAEDREELRAVAELHPDAIDYLDVYDRAGGLGPQAILAHAIHLSEREIGRLAETRAVVAHCPASNLFLASGAMPLARYQAAAIRIGLGSDVSAGPELSIFTNMRAGAYTQSGLLARADGRGPASLRPLDWLRLGTLDGAEALGLAAEIGSLEPGKEGDVIAVDPRLVAPIEGVDSDDPAEIMSRLAFRPHQDMVRAAWVRGRLLDGPLGLA
jgi:guanine deaminase